MPGALDFGPAVRLNPGVPGRSSSLLLSSLLVLWAAAAHADRAVTAVLWVGGEGGAAVAAQVDAALAGSTSLAPIAEADAKRLLLEGGPATRVRERVAAGRDRLASLRDLPEADRLLAEAEDIALVELPVAAACPQVAEIARLRLRLAELHRDEPRAVHAALLLRACAAPATAEDTAATARHPAPSPAAARPLRVESDPPGASVFLDLQAVGATPLELTAPRRADALLDVERAGLRKAHRVLDGAGGGTLAVALGRDDGLAALVDRVREGAEAKPADVKELARRVGAAQLLALRGGREGMLDARLFDAARGAWIKPAAELKAPSPRSAPRRCGAPRVPHPGARRCRARGSSGGGQQARQGPMSPSPPTSAGTRGSSAGR